jgi:hypothetical protein
MALLSTTIATLPSQISNIQEETPKLQETPFPIDHTQTTLNHQIR